MAALKLEPDKKNIINFKLGRIINKINHIPLQNAFRKWYKISTKKPDYAAVIKGSDKLRSGLIKYAGEPIFEDLKNYISPANLAKKIRQKIG